MPRRSSGRYSRKLRYTESSFARALRVAAALALLAAPLSAQTIDDGLMLAKRELLTGNVFTHDTWDTYWEGTLKRQNGNIGEIRTSRSPIPRMRRAPTPTWRWHRPMP